MSLAALKQTLQRFGILVAFLILCLALSLLSDRFLTTGNLVNILRQAAITGTIAVGMTMVILTGGIDLSVVGAATLSSIAAAPVLARFDGDGGAGWRWNRPAAPHVNKKTAADFTRAFRHGGQPRREPVGQRAQAPADERLRRTPAYKHGRGDRLHACPLPKPSSPRAA